MRKREYIIEKITECHPLALFMLIWCFTLTAIQVEAKTSDPQQSIIGIKAYIPKAARTAQTLGLERSGSGIVIDNQGLIVTIGYIILEAETVQIIDIDGSTVSASIIGYDAETGFGLVRSVTDLKATPVNLGHSAGLSMRDPVTILSNSQQPETYQAFVATRKTFAGYWEYLLENAIFTIPVVSSFAGAALIDQSGSLVGVGSLVIGEVLQLRGQSVPGNMFVPIDQLKPIIKDLVKNGRPSGPQRPWLGITVDEQFGRVIVLRVGPTGPAQLAGIEPGDIILKIGEHSIDSMETLYRTLWKLGNAGIEVPITLLHRNSIQQIKIISGNRYNHYRISHIY